MMKKIFWNMFLGIAITSGAMAQERYWTMDDCMRYAVENSPKVKQKQHLNDSYKVAHRSAVASFFPSIGASVGGQFSFGRSIDPKTNTYNNISTFNNSYGISASLPLFDGGQLINNQKMTRIRRLYGMQEEQRAKDDVALAVMEAFINTVYYRGTVKLAADKLNESRRTLHKTRCMEELGMKGKADVAQFEAQVAADDYNLTRQQNLYASAFLKLRENMNYCGADSLRIDTAVYVSATLSSPESVSDIYAYASTHNPVALSAEYQSKAARYEYRMAKGAMFPRLSFEAGVSTNYFKNLSSGETVSFGKQFFDNNRGEYLAMVLRIPLFDGLGRYSEARRARNNMRMANEQREEIMRQLQTAVEQAVLDRDGFAKETVQMEKKVEADEISYHLTLRKYEEGLMSPLDLQTAANTLIEARANLLQKRLSYLLKSRLVAYYKGEGIIGKFEE